MSVMSTAMIFLRSIATVVSEPAEQAQTLVTVVNPLSG